VKIIRWVGIVLVAIVLAAGITASATRSADGPLAIFPGGELVAGDWLDSTSADAERLATTGQIEFQLLTPPRSRTTWVVVHEGEIYIPCGTPTVSFFKQWPHEAMKDGRAVIRFDGKRQRRTAVRVHDRDIRAALLREVARKYPGPEGDVEDEDQAWFFRLDPRSEG